MLCDAINLLTKKTETHRNSEVLGGCVVQMAELERQAEHMVELESRAEVAEGERDAALDKMHLMTPRPSLSPSIDLPNQLGPEGASKFLAAINKHRSVPPASVYTPIL